MNKSWLAALGVVLVAGGLGFWLTSNDEPAGPLVPAAAAPSVGAPAAAPPPSAPQAASPAADPARDDAGKAARSEAAVGGDGEPVSGDEAPAALPTGGIAPETMDAVRGLDRPRRTLGEPATAAAMEEDDMSELEVTDPGYDEVIDAHQLFHELETDILSRGQITPEVWAELMAAHAPAKEEMLERSVELARSGKANESESILLEWNALEGGYQEQVE